MAGVPDTTVEPRTTVAPGTTVAGVPDTTVEPRTTVVPKRRVVVVLVRVTMDTDFNAWTAENSAQFLALVAAQMKIPMTQILAKYRAGSVIADLRLRKDISTPDKLTRLHAAIDVIQTTSPEYRITTNVIVETDEDEKEEEEVTPSPPVHLPEEASRTPRGAPSQGDFTENGVVIFGSVIIACMVIVCCVAMAYYYFFKFNKSPKPQKGHIENFAIPVRKPRTVPFGFGRALQAVFPRVKWTEKDASETEQLQEVVTGDSPTSQNTESKSGSTSVPDRSLVKEQRRSLFHGSERAPEVPNVFAEVSPSPPTLRMESNMRSNERMARVYANPPTLDIPGTVTETDVDVLAKVISPQRPRPVSPRQAMWHSGVNGGSAKDTADTVTTERLGTISRAQSSGLTVEYPQRSRNDSVFDATTTDATSPSLASTLVSFDNTSPGHFPNVESRESRTSRRITRRPRRISFKKKTFAK